jgi:hypothetical protein
MIKTPTKEPTMAVAVTIDIPGGNQQAYEQLTSSGWFRAVAGSVAAWGVRP